LLFSHLLTLLAVERVGKKIAVVTPEKLTQVIEGINEMIG